MCKDLVLTAKKTQNFSIAKSSLLIAYRYVIVILTVNHMKRINTLCGPSAHIHY
jgi:hypothetical protein